jgi:hypothetical protein
MGMGCSGRTTVTSRIRNVMPPFYCFLAPRATWGRTTVTSLKSICHKPLIASNTPYIPYFEPKIPCLRRAKARALILDSQDIVLPNPYEMRLCAYAGRIAGRNHKETRLFHEAIQIAAKARKQESHSLGDPKL